MPQSGCETLSLPGICRPATLTSGTSPMLPPATSPDTGNAISSPGSAVGPTRSGSPAGRMTNPCGPAPVPVSRFRARDSEKAMPTTDTSGPLFTASSPSAALQRSLESRLRARLAASGSPEYALTWRQQDMPSGPPICALRASARRISGNGCSGWPTPRSAESGHSSGNPIRMMNHKSRLEDAAYLSGWPSPRAGNHTGASENPKFSPNLQTVAGWATPTKTDADRRGELSIAPKNATLNHMAGWATPSARDWKNGQASQETMERNARPLNEQAVQYVAGWVTPQSRDGANSRGGMADRALGRRRNLDDQVMLGPVPNGSPASTEYAWHDIWHAEKHVAPLHLKLMVQFAPVCRRQGAWGLPRWCRRRMGGSFVASRHFNRDA